MIVGIPRALLFYFFDDLWISFFKNLNIKTVLSPPTNKDIIKKGINNSIDEGCYSSKIFIGHVEYLLDKCDMIFIPRIENLGVREDYCTRIFGLYDLVVNTFPEAKLLHANINYLYREKEADAFLKIGVSLGKTKDETTKAYTDALLFYNQERERKISEQKKLLESESIKVLIMSHAYNTFDATIGMPVVKFFKDNSINVIYADLINSKEAQITVKENYGNRIYWKINAELLGGVETYRDQVDGIVLISTFPCGPDSIFNELMIRMIKDKPVLSLLVDEQDATAGLLTRLESFIDIIEAKKRGFGNAE